MENTQKAYILEEGGKETFKEMWGLRRALTLCGWVCVNSRPFLLPSLRKPRPLNEERLGSVGMVPLTTEDEYKRRPAVAWDASLPVSSSGRGSSPSPLEAL